MKSHSSLVERAAQTLARAPVGADAGDDEADARAIAAMKAALQVRARRRRTRPKIAIACGALVLAAGAIFALNRWKSGPAPIATTSVPSSSAPVAAAVARSVHGDVVHITKKGPEPVREASSIDVGDRIITLHGASLDVALPTGTQLSLEGGTDVTVLKNAPTQVFALSTGSLFAKVAKLSAGERFIIRTGDAEVEVRGTAFRVAQAAPDPACGSGTTTRVRVDEGVVTVRANGREWNVRATESWPPCESAAPPPSTAKSTPVPSAVVPTPRVASSSPPKGTSGPSALALQNDLFDEAMSAKRRGDLVLALTLLDRLLETYPSSPLTEQAKSEREKLANLPPE